MIQRIQTLYLFLAFVVTGILPFFISAMEHERRKEYFYAKSVLYHTFGFKRPFTS
jgi:hypothetical protein